MTSWKQKPGAMVPYNQALTASEVVGNVAQLDFFVWIRRIFDAGHAAQSQQQGSHHLGESLATLVF